MIVVQMHGEPGSGKTTVARSLAPRIGAVVLDKDVVKAALLRSGVSEAQAAPAAYEAFFALAASFLAQGRSVVLDSPVFWRIVDERSRRVAREAGVPYFLIECVCPDRDELGRRLLERDALESQPRQPLDRVDGMAEPAGPRLVLDTTRPIDGLIAEAADYVRAGVVR